MSNNSTGRLRQADGAAQQLSARPAESAVESCPDERPLDAIAVTMIDEADQPIANMVFELLRRENECLYGKTDSQGRLHFGGLPPGIYQLTPYRLDQEAWVLLRSEAFEPDGVLGQAPAVWQAEARPVNEGFVHTVAQGECTAKLAYRFGHLPGTVWNAPENDTLRKQRDHPNILAPADHLTIPALRYRSLSVHTGQHYILRRKGVPDVVKVRFLQGEAPRAGLLFIAAPRFVDGRPAPDVQGRTDANGIATVAVMPDVTQIDLFLDHGEDVEMYVINVGQVDPIGWHDGVLQRLRNLGFDAAPESLASFQAAYGLPVTGELNEATLRRLQDVHLS